MINYMNIQTIFIKLYFMINNLYNDTKPKRTNLRIQTEKDEYLKFHVLKKMKN